MTAAVLRPALATLQSCGVNHDKEQEEKALERPREDHASEQKQLVTLKSELPTGASLKIQKEYSDN